MIKHAQQVAVAEPDQMAPAAAEAADEHIAPAPRVSVQAFCESVETAAAVQAAGEDRRLAKAHVKIQMGGATAAVVAGAVTEISSATSASTPSSIVLRDATGSFSAGTVTASFIGNAGGLTNLNATNLIGSLPKGALSGVYSNALSLTNTTNLIAGTFTGSGAGLTGLSAANLTGTIPSASIAAGS